jgi:hypothetical protein
MTHTAPRIAVLCSVLVLSSFAPAGAQDAWTGTNVGPVGIGGSASTNPNGRMKVSAEGTDIWSSEDGFYFVYRTLAGDGEISARVSSLQNTDAWAKAGVMIRQALDGRSIDAALVVTPSNGIAFQDRSTYGGETARTLAAGGAGTWLRLVRSGSSVSAFRSSDGVRWTALGTRTIPLHGPVLVGLAVTSRRPSKLTNAWFESVRLADSAVLPPAPVAAWAFDEGMGSVARDSFGGNHGTVAGAAWTRSGRNGGALVFDGLDDVVTVPDSASLRLSAGMTVSAWVKPASLSGWRSVAGKEAPSSHAYALYANNGSQQPTGLVSVDSAEVPVNCQQQLPLDAWSHIGVTFDGTTLRFFVNGSSAGTRAVSGNILQTSGALRIGGNSVFGEWFHGTIDDLRVYDRALSDAEIQADMNTAVPSTPLVDSTAPSVAISSPTSGATLAGTVTVSANATDDVEVASVQFRLNGSDLGAPVTVSPYVTTFDARKVANGPHTLTAVATDAAGNRATSATVSVTVNNPDTTPPTVAMTSPVGGATLSGTVSVVASATDDVKMGSVQFRLNGANLGAAVSAAPYGTVFDTTKVANGTHTLTAVATDAAGNQATSAPVSVTVNNPDKTPPAVALTSPAAGAVISGTASLTATATDDTRVASVQFRVNTSNLGAAVTVAPYVTSFSTTSVANGTYTLTAVATDAAGNQATSAPVSVMVNNVTLIVNVKTVEFTSADHNALLSDGRPVISGYTLEIWTSGSNPSTATPYRTSDMGRPASTTTLISVNQEAFLASLPKGQQFFATVRATGPGGSSRSSGSSLFSIQ